MQANKGDVEAFFEAHGSSHVEGFVVWVGDMREETVEDLRETNGQRRLASSMVFAARASTMHDYDGVEAAVEAYLDEHKAALVAALED